MRAILLSSGAHLRRSSYFRNSLQRRLLATSSSGSDVQDCDIVVVGGGPAGLAFANALASQRAARDSLRIVLIEAGDLNRVREWSLPDESFSNRVSSITNASRAFLENVGAWKYVDNARVTRIEEMQVWDGISDARIAFSSNDAGLDGEGHSPYMATMTENLNLQRALLQCLDKFHAVQIYDNTKVSAIEKESSRGGWPLIHTSTGVTLRARLLVGADGPNSPVRAYAGIESSGWAYDTRAIVATLNHTPRLENLQNPNTTAYQRFLPTGPIAFLPLSPTVSSLVWSTKPSLASALSAADPQALAFMINAAFRLPEVSVQYLHRLWQEDPQKITPEILLEEIKWRERSHNIDHNSAYSSQGVASSGVPPSDAEAIPPAVISVQHGTIASFPLRMTHADSYIGMDERGSRTVLLGDAAHTIHPLAGQGLNMGLADAQALANCVTSAVNVGADIGSITALHPYPRARYLENHKLLSATDKLHKLYSSTAPPIVWARTVGLEIVNEFDTLKAALMLTAGSNVTMPHAGMTEGNKTATDVAATGVGFVAEVYDTAKFTSRLAKDITLSGLNYLANTYGRR